MTLGQEWERHAADWIAWARTPGHDGFWEGTWPALQRLFPHPVSGPVLDHGCGEGRAGRLLVAAGLPVVGVDRSPTLTSAAAGGDPALPVALADAAALPFPDAVFGLVVASMSLHDIDDFERAMAEVGRVLRPDGVLCLAVVHPFCTAQDEETSHTGEFRVSRPYLQSRRYEDHIARSGLKMTFASMHRPFRDYVTALTGAGLVITALGEDGEGAVPWLLTIRAEPR